MASPPKGQGPSSVVLLTLDLGTTGHRTDQTVEDCQARWSHAGQVGLWRPPGPETSAAGPGPAAAGDSIRWLPLQRRTASWPAAYNTACLYAALARENRAPDDLVAISLGRAVNNGDSEDGQAVRLEPHVFRAPCTVILETPALVMRRSKLRLKLRGSTGVPWRVVNSRPVSIQASPALSRSVSCSCLRS
jgi:hypothetical protein